MLVASLTSVKKKEKKPSPSDMKISGRQPLKMIRCVILLKITPLTDKCE
jgi:hypothetical protein